MQVKKYVVDSMPEALKKIRKDLGSNAVIIDSKKIKTGGIFGFFGKQQIEVIAASDEQKREPKKELNQTKQTATSQPRASEDIPYTPPQPINPDLKTTQSAAPSQENIILAKQMQEMKDLLTKFIIKDGQANEASDQSFEELRKQGIDDNLLSEVMNEWLNINMKNGTEISHTESDDDDAKRNQMKQVLKAYVVPHIAEGISPTTSLAHFIGPTGVGKTTTIAKIAAEQVLKFKRKVGLITSDTYRIAAVDQLRTYANILNVPLEVVYSAKEMSEALNKLSDCDLILMDTAGRNYRNELYVNELKNLLSKYEHSETYLVLSMASKYEDMKQIIDNFKAVVINKLIFTKLDETSTYGALFNILHNYKIPLSYMAYGQNVPDDLSLADSEKLIESVLGERVYGS